MASKSKTVKFKGKVVATERGYYKNRIIEAGQKFLLDEELEVDEDHPKGKFPLWVQDPYETEDEEMIEGEEVDEAGNVLDEEVDEADADIARPARKVAKKAPAKKAQKKSPAKKVSKTVKKEESEEPGMVQNFVDSVKSAINGEKEDSII